MIPNVFTRILNDKTIIYNFKMADGDYMCVEYNINSEEWRGSFIELNRTIAYNYNSYEYIDVYVELPRFVMKDIIRKGLFR